MEEIQHFIHHHPLTPCNDSMFYGKYCNGCKRRISGPGFLCKQCVSSSVFRRSYEKYEYIIDRWCAELPRTITHPFHPQHTLILNTNTTQLYCHTRCHACGYSIRGFFFYCSLPDCQFQLDAVCVCLTPTKNNHQDHQHKIKRESLDQHQIQTLAHPLIMCDIMNKMNFDRSCSVCRLPFEEDSIYVCLECKLLLHKSCFELPLEIKHHPLHPPHPTLTLLSTPYDPSSECHACGKGDMLFTYTCLECPFQLDIVCAWLTLATNPEDHQQHLIQHLSLDGQNHPLIICDMKNNKFNPSCAVCLLPFEDSMIYVCLDCRILLHKSCIEWPFKIKNHPFHPEYSLTTSYPPDYDCRVCEESISYGYSYFCINYKSQIRSSSYYIHAKCASVKPTIMCDLHSDHPLAFIKKKKGSFGDFRCETCDCHLDTAVFRCAICDYSIHVRCYPTLPNTIKFEYHLHPLTITNSPVKDRRDEDEDAELYCDACKERRYILHPTYYCAECHFVAHVDCDSVISEVLRVLEEEWSLACKTEETKLETSTDVINEKIDEVVSSNILETDLVESKLESDVGASEEEGVKEKIDQVVSDAMKPEEEEEGAKVETDSGTSEKVEVHKAELEDLIAKLEELEEKRSQYDHALGTSNSNSGN